MHMRGLKTEYQARERERKLIKRQVQERTIAQAANKVLGLELQYLDDDATRATMYSELHYFDDSDTSSSSGSYAASTEEYSNESSLKTRSSVGLP